MQTWAPLKFKKIDTHASMLNGNDMSKHETNKINIISINNYNYIKRMFSV